MASRIAAQRRIREHLLPSVNRFFSQPAVADSPPVPVHAPTGFDLKNYAQQTGTLHDLLCEMLRELCGILHSWTITVNEPQNVDPHGQLSIQHDSFGTCQGVVVDSEYDGRRHVYTVYRVNERGVVEELSTTSVEVAVAKAVEAANDEWRTRLTGPFDDTIIGDGILRSAQTWNRVRCSLGHVFNRFKPIGGTTDETANEHTMIRIDGLGWRRYPQGPTHRMTVATTTALTAIVKRAVIIYLRA